MRWWPHGNGLRIPARVLAWADVYFYPMGGPADEMIRMACRLLGRPKSVYQVETTLPVPDWMDVPKRALASMESWIRDANVVTGVSESIVRRLRAEEGRLDAFRVPVGIDLERIRQIGQEVPGEAPGGRVGVLFVGSLKVGKRPGVVLDAAARFREADFRLVGDGPLLGDLRRRVERESLGNVTLLGGMGNDEVLREMSRASVFLFPSVHEGQPRVVLEAAASGLPVVCQDDYAPEGVENGVTGFTAGDDEVLMTRLGVLLGDPRMRKEMGEAGRRVAAGFDWDRIVPTWEETLWRLGRP